MPERVYHEVNQAGNAKSTSLSASRKDFISTWPACLWTSANSLLEALCTILPLPSTLHLCSLVFRRLYQKYSGEKKRDTFFQQHQLLPTRDHVHQIPSPGMLALFKKSFTKIYSPVVPCQWLCFQGSYPRCDSTTGFRTHSSPQLEQSSSLQPLKQKHFWSCELSLFDLPPTSSCCPGEQMYCIQCPVLPASHQVYGSRPWVVNVTSVDWFLRPKYIPIQAVSSSKKVAHSRLSRRVKQLMTIGNAQYSNLQHFHLKFHRL